ncbi:hypothetical protein ACFWV1_16605 [Streptomyces sp. NPDC058700]|uniref:hypothetical protein n=1 Tax=Streptomyces sp. NPDC058700 TaxID=3346607 RepID=UPI0036526BB5
MTGEQRPRTPSRITDALLPTETTTRLRAIRPNEPRTEPAQPNTAPEPERADAAHTGARAGTDASARRATGTETPTRPAHGAARRTTTSEPPIPTAPTAGPAGPAGRGTTPGTPAPSAPARPASSPGTSATTAPARPAWSPVIPSPSSPASASAASGAASGYAPAPPPYPASPLTPYGRTTPYDPYGHHAPSPEAPGETTTRLRPVRERRTGRGILVAVCAVLGAGLIGGSLVGVWLAAAEPGKPAEPAGYTEAMDLWHNAPVDTLFPRTLAGPGAGPGAAARTWTRIVVAPDAACSPAVLAKGLLTALRPLGCERVLRATYTDATASSVITVGLVFTRADAHTQRTLAEGGGLTPRLGADIPPALSGHGTVAARFGAAQRASWWLNAPADLPVVVTAVSGFADGRAVDGPQPADRAMAAGRTDATAQSGLGHEAKGITARFVGLLRTTVASAAKEKNAR